MPQIRGVRGEAVQVYRKLLTTKEMRYLRLSRRGKNMAKMANILEFTSGQILFKTLVYYFMLYYQNLILSSPCFLCNVRVNR